MKPKLYKRGASWHCEGDGIHCWARNQAIAFTNWKIRWINKVFSKE